MKLIKCCWSFLKINKPEIHMESKKNLIFGLWNCSLCQKIYQRIRHAIFLIPCFRIWKKGLLSVSQSQSGPNQVWCSFSFKNVLYSNLRHETESCHVTLGPYGDQTAFSSGCCRMCCLHNIACRDFRNLFFHILRTWRMGSKKSKQPVITINTYKPYSENPTSVVMDILYSLKKQCLYCMSK